MKKIILVLFVMLLTVVTIKTPVLANSAQTRWHGTDSTGSIILDEESPIIVEKELLTFDIEEFPESYYKELDDFLSYSGKVTAEYTFYNPAEYTVTATLAFPFGGVADYADLYDDKKEKPLINVDTEKYDIKINGNIIDKQIRHTYMEYGAQFNLEEDLVKLHDGYMVDDFYNPNLTVTKYTYIAKDVDKEEYNAANAGFIVSEDNNTKIYMENNSGGSVLDEGIMLTTWVDLKEEFSVYAIGEPFDEELNWKFYANGSCEDEIKGSMELISTESMTLKDFVLSKYNPESGVLDYDWYNAMITSFKRYEWANGAIHSSEITFDISGKLMRWYQYEISLEPKQRIVNTVTAPIYPSINSDYEPAIFEYTYLLSPAKTWKEFGNLDIIINTPFNLLENNIEGFEYINPGYELHLTGLPEGDLVFVLSSEDQPLYNRNNYFDIRFVIAGVVILTGSTAIVITNKSKKKNKLV